MPKYCRFKPPPTPAPLYRTVPYCVIKSRGGVALSPRRTAEGGFGGVNASGPFIHTVKPMPAKPTTITAHAERRWAERIDYPAVSIHWAWREAVPVGPPPRTDLHGKLRLHEPADALFVYDCAEEDRGRYILKTVLVASIAGRVPEDYRTAHLKHCRTCGYLWNPERSETCHWCPLPRLRYDYDETIDPEYTPI